MSCRVWVLLGTTVLIGLGAARADGGTDALQLLSAIAQHHKELSEFAVDIDVAISRSGPSGVTHALPARVAKRNGVTLQEFAGYELLVGRELTLLVDRRARTLHLASGAARSAVTSEFDPEQALVRLRSSGYVLTVSERQAEKRLEFRDPTSRKLIAVSVDAASSRLQAFEVVQTDADGAATHTVVRYRWGDAATWAPERFDVAHYLQQLPSGWVPAPAFNGYRVLLQRGG